MTTMSTTAKKNNNSCKFIVVLASKRLRSTKSFVMHKYKENRLTLRVVNRSKQDYC